MSSGYTQYNDLESGFAFPVQPSGETRLPETFVVTRVKLATTSSEAAETLTLLHGTGILSDSRYQEALRAVTENPTDRQTLLKRLLQARWITLFQADAAVRGRLRLLRIANRYLLEDIIGVGGMGAVYRARDLQTGQELALKRLSETYKHDTGMRARFRLEGKAGLRLDHPHLVKTFDLGQTDDVYGEVEFVTMELFESIALHELIAFNGPLRKSQACDVLAQVCLGLEYIHQQGLVHRDVKPDNILVGRDGFAKLVDFGLTLVDQEVVGEEFSLAMIFGHDCLGTADYMAPEQSIDSLHVTPQADVYGLGCTLFMCLTGRRPFQGLNKAEILQAQRTRPFPPISTYRLEIPDELEQLCQQMVAKNPEDRPSLEEVRTVLLRYAKRVPPDYDPDRLKRARRGIYAKRLDASRSSMARFSSSMAALRTTDVPVRTDVDQASESAPRPRRKSAPVPQVSSADRARELLNQDVGATGPGLPPSLRLSDGSTVVLTEREYVVGSAPECDIRLKLPGIMGRHCRLHRAADGWWVTVLDAPRGILLNGKPAHHQRIRHRDRLTFGNELTACFEQPGAKTSGRWSWWVWLILAGMIAATIWLIITWTG